MDIKDEVVIKFMPSDEPGGIIMDVKMPLDMDPDNLRPFETAAMYALQAIEMVAGDISKVEQN